jgi:hypothetical protein
MANLESVALSKTTLEQWLRSPHPAYDKMLDAFALNARMGPFTVFHAVPGPSLLSSVVVLPSFAFFPSFTFFFLLPSFASLLPHAFYGSPA